MAIKRVELEVNGKIIRVAEHMVADVLKFGATYTKRIIKEPPVEIIMPLPKKIIIPRTDNLKKLEEIVKEPLKETVSESIKDEIKSPDTEETPKIESEIKSPVVKKVVSKRKPAKKVKR